MSLKFKIEMWLVKTLKPYFNYGKEFNEFEERLDNLNKKISFFYDKREDIELANEILAGLLDYLEVEPKRVTIKDPQFIEPKMPTITVLKIVKKKK